MRVAMRRHLFLVIGYHRASLAQLAEHPSGNRKVPEAGTNPGRGNELFLDHPAGSIKLLS